MKTNKLIITLVLVFLLIQITINSYAEAEQNTTIIEPTISASDQTPETITNLNNKVIQSSDELSLYSPYAILMEAKTGKILYQRQAFTQMYPASTTKVMTAILTLEHCSLNDTATASYTAIHSVPYSYTIANIQENETLTIEELLECLLIPSANDAAFILAEKVGGTLDNFYDMMNKKAKEIGCLNTHFVNPNGIHADNHYSTVYDLALMGQYAMKNADFKRIVAMEECQLSDLRAPEDRKFKSTNNLLPNKKYFYEGVIGIKTGYTGQSKKTMISYCTRNNEDYILAVGGADTTTDFKDARFLDCITLFDYAYNNYETKAFKKANSVIETKEIENATKETKNLDILIEDKLDVLCKKTEDLESIKPKITYSQDFEFIAPIKKNTIVGKIEYEIDGIKYTSNLITGNDVKRSYEKEIILGAKIAAGVLLFLIILIIINHNRKKRKELSYSNNNRKGRTKSKHELSDGFFKYDYQNYNN